jgi:hypothetical protein
MDTRIPSDGWSACGTHQLSADNARCIQIDRLRKRNSAGIRCSDPLRKVQCRLGHCTFAVGRAGGAVPSGTAPYGSTVLHFRGALEFLPSLKRPTHEQLLKDRP